MKGRGNRRGTLKEVATRAGVSVAAVSKVLNGRGDNVRIASLTADRIREAAKDLNYVPNALARSLRMQQNHTIGLVFENFGAISEGPLFYVHMLDGIAAQLFSRGYRLTIIPEIDHDDPISTVGDGRLDGIVWCKMPTSPDIVQALSRSPVPFVALHARPEEALASTVFVCCDNAGGIDLAIEHLVELGHTSLLFVMEEGETDVPDAMERLEAFRRGCTARELDHRVTIWHHDLREMTAWSKNRPRETGVICWNERMAAEFVTRARQIGLLIPQHISVVGFDSTPFSDSTNPPLTAVRQPIRAMASQAAATLIDLVEGRPVSRNDLIFPCTLDVRASTGPVPSTRPKTSTQRIPS